MRATPVNLIGGFYADDTRPWSVQDTVNWLPVMAEQGGTLTPAKLATPPGLFPWQKIGTGPIRGMHDCEGQRFIVSGRTLYRITNAGVGIPLGTVPGVGRVSISHNQFKGGNQVLVCNGAPGGGYVYDTRAQTFERIADPGFPGSLQTAYIDSYLLGVEPFGRFWFHSNLADATDYNTLDRYEAEAAPDRIVGLAVSQLEVIVFGERTVEFYGNAGGATGTFQSKRAVIDRGCASRHAICNLDNSVFWLGDDGIVYRLEDYAARRVSTVPLERALASLRWSDAFAFTWEDRGHKVYYLTFPDGQTWGFDVVSGLWHRRESYGLNRWRLNDMVRWGNAWYGGDMQDGRIWQLDWEYPAEGDQPMVSERTSPVMADNQSAFVVPNVELLIGAGQQPAVINGEFPVQPVGPTITGDAPDGIAGDLWPGYAYTASGGTPPYQFKVQSGSLPAGAALSIDGAMPPFTPATGGISTYVVRAIDANGLYADVADSIAIHAEAIACGVEQSFSGGQSFPSVFEVLLGSENGEVEVYSAFGIPDKVEVWIGGVLRYTSGYRGYTYNQADLDLVLDTARAPRESVVSGDPHTGAFYKSSGESIAEVRVYAPIPLTGWTVRVGCPDIDVPAAGLSIGGQCPDPLIGYTFPFAYAINGGVEPHTVEVVAGALPPGRAIDSATGVVTGEYTATGTYSFTVRVTDALGATAEMTDTVQVLSAYP